MNDATPCGPEHAPACPSAAGSPHPCDPGPLDLNEALGRFAQEAVHGTCDTGRYRMPYFSWGAGPPLLCIHGVGDGGRSFVLPLARLSAHFRCIGYDLPAGGADGARLGHYTHADLVSDVGALLDHLHLPRAYVLATSFGATVALAALHARPERLPRAVLQGAFARRPLARRERLLARLARFSPGTMARVPLRRLVVRALSAESFASRPADLWDHFLRSSGQARIAAFARQVLLLDRLDLRPLLPEIRQPVLLVRGERDPVIPPALGEEVLHGLPNARQAEIEGCGHVPAYSHPEALAELTRRFLTPPGVAGSSCSGTGCPAGPCGA